MDLRNLFTVIQPLHYNASIFTTDNNGYIDISGLVAGHDYYLKELVAPSGYPDISEEVIRLSIGSLGQASVSSSADATDGDVTWKLSEVTSSETEGSTNKGTFTLSMTVKNRHQVSITAQKIWAMLYDWSAAWRLYIIWYHAEY